jgi:hypothetical protein
LIVQGFWIFWQNLNIGSAFLLSSFVFGMGGVSQSFCRSTNLTSALLIILAFCKGFILSSFSFLLLLGVAVLLKIHWSALEILVISFSLAIALNLINYRSLILYLHQDAWQILIVLLVFLFVVIVRLSFINGLSFPLYSDSASHYLIIKDFLTLALGPQSFPFLPGVLQRYYHYGFHSLAAWLTVVVQGNIATVMLVLGQFLVALIPFTVYFFIKAETNSNRAAIFSAALSMLGWTMPEYAINWGKYPAVAGIALVPITISLDRFFLSRRTRTTFVYALIFTLGTAIFHSRALLLVLLALGSIALAQTIRRWSTRVYALCLAAFIMIGWLFCRTGPELWQRYLSPALLVLLLFPLALKKNQAIALGMLIFAISLLAAYFIPLPDAFHDYSNLLLDRPFVEMSLFFPLSAIGGLGIAGLVDLLNHRAVAATALSGVLLGALIVEAALSPANFLPNPATNFISPDDLTAMAWVKGHVPSDAIIFISSIPNQEGSFAGSDAGVWIGPLFGISTRPLSYATAWGLPSLEQTLCVDQRPTYLYLGDAEYSFLSTPPVEGERYRLVFSTRYVDIFQVGGCNSGLK